MPVSFGQTFGVLRTNHKLTGNVKVSVDSKGDVFLNSINANTELADSRFKKVRVNPKNKLSADLQKFFENGNMPSNLIYDTYRVSDDLTSKTLFSRHFEQQYSYGVGRCNSELFDEQYCMFAPLWLTKQIPKYFIVFRNKGARPIEYVRNPEMLEVGKQFRVVGDGSFTLTYGTSTYTNGDTFVPDEVNGTGYIIDGDGYVVLDDPEFESNTVIDPNNLKDNLISPSDIAAIFDLSENTNIGKYLRKHINDPLFSENMVNIDFANNQFTYTGIDLKTGVISTIPENLSDLTAAELDIIDFDEFVSQGYERNKLVSNNLLNMEFMFDDPLSNDYTFNRYYGFYCDDIDVGKFYLDRHAMFSKSDGLYSNPYHNKESVPFYYGRNIEDEGGVKVIPEEIEGSEGYILDLDRIQGNPSFFYIKDKYGDLHKINNNESVDHHTLMDTELDSEKLFNFTDEHFELEVTRLSQGGKSSVTIQVNQDIIPLGYRIEVYYNNTLLGKVQADHLPNVTTAELALIPDDYSGDPSTPYQEGESVAYFFYPTGTTEQIAQGLTSAFDYLLRDNNIDAVHMEDRVVLVSRSFGVENDNFHIRLVNDQGEMSANNTKFSGGSTSFTSRVRIDADLTDQITDKSYILTDRGYSKVRSITSYLDEPIRGDDGLITDYNGFDQYKVINIVDERQQIKIANGAMSVYNEQKLAIGVLSLYDIKDFDFDFFKSDYSKSLDNEYKKYFKTDVSKLIVGDKYTVYKLPVDPLPPSVIHDGVTYTEGQSFVAVSNEFIIVDGDPIVVNDKYYDDEELKSFVGFNTIDVGQVGLVDLTSLDPDALENKNALLSFAQGITEYNRQRELVKSKNSLKSKIIPYINKWVLEDGKNVRDVEYRLNLSKAFGEMNFSPSFIDETQNPFFFTHEWLYLSNIPENILQNDLIKSTPYFTKRFSVDKLVNNQLDYFTDYFTVDSHILKSGMNEYSVLEVPTQRRFTEFRKISDQNFETFFRGVRVKLLSPEVDYTDYKFSAVLNFNKTKFLQPEEPFKVTVVENRDYKNITLVVDITVDDYKVAPDILLPPFGEYLYLYVMDSLKRWDDKVADIRDVNQGGGYFTAVNDVDKFIGGQIKVKDSTGNDGIYTVVSTTLTALGTEIYVAEPIPDSTVDGFIANYNHTFGLYFDYPELISVDFFNGVTTPDPVKATMFKGYQLFNRTNMVGISNPNILRFNNDLFLFQELMKVNSDGNYARLLGMDAEDAFMLTSDDVFFSATQYILDRANTIVQIGGTGLFENDVLLQNSGMGVVNIPYLLAVGSNDPINVQTTLYDMKLLTWFHENGGLDVYEDIVSKVSFGQLSDIINEASKHLTYKLIEGGAEVGTDSAFSLKVIEPSIIKRNESIAVSQTNETFPELPSESVVDYNTVNVEENVQFLRYSGNYIPKFRDVFAFKNEKLVMTWGLYDIPWNEANHTWNEFRDDIIFIQWSDITESWDSYEFTWLDADVDINNINQNTIPFSRRLFGENTKFDTTVEDFAEIDNFFHHKVSPEIESLLSLPEPKYPTIGEIAIDRMDINVLKSDFDAKFYKKYTDKQLFEFIHGSHGDMDVKSFLGTKLLHIEKAIELHKFEDIITDTGIDDLQYDIGTSQMAAEVIGNEIIFRVSLAKMLEDYVFERMSADYMKFVNEFNTIQGNFNDAMRAYIQNNIIPLYKISEVKTFVKKFNLEENVDLIYNEDNELVLIQNGYLENKNVSTENVNNLEVIIKYTQSPEFNHSYNIRVTVSA